MKILMFILMFFLIGALFIISQNNINLDSKNDVQAFNQLYTSWLDKTFSNIVSVTGNVVRLDWLPDAENKTR